jgi:hypothetical protein
MRPSQRRFELLLHYKYKEIIAIRIKKTQSDKN